MYTCSVPCHAGAPPPPHSAWYRPGERLATCTCSPGISIEYRRRDRYRTTGHARGPTRKRKKKKPVPKLRVECKDPPKLSRCAQCVCVCHDAAFRASHLLRVRVTSLSDPSGPRWHGGTLPRTGHPPDRVSTCPAPRDCSSRARSYQVCYTPPSQRAAMKGQVELPLMKPSHGLPRGLNPVLGLPMSPPMSHQQAYGAPYYNTSMEAVWHGEFSKLFSQFYPHLWYLIPSPAAPSPRWYRFRDSAKVRFSCQQCGNGWTSMKGRVIFWYYLNPQGVPVPEGYLHFKLYGQQCKRCKNGRFEMAMWYPEEVVKVLGNVYNRVGQTYYGFYQPPLRQDRRPGKPRTQHNAELCQACKDGECTNAH